MWYGRVWVRYGEAGCGYGMVWSGRWCGILGTVLYGRVPVSSGMLYGIFLVCGTVLFVRYSSGMWYGIFCMVRYGLVYKGCGQTDRQANLHSPKQSLSFTN